MDLWTHFGTDSLGFVCDTFLFCLVMLPSSYPYTILVMLGKLTGLCFEALHSGTDLLCFVCVRHFVVLGSIPTLWPLGYNYAAFLLSLFHIGDAQWARWPLL